MNGNPPAAKLLQKVGLSHLCDLSASPQRDAAIYEQPQRQVQPGLVFGQIQPAQGLIINCDQHTNTLTAPMLTGKRGETVRDTGRKFLLHFAFCILHFEWMTFSPLPRSFYAPSARVVARRLLGHWLIRRAPDGFCGGPIVETEAYLRDDPASHGFGGETKRNRAMYGPPGHAYVYFIYGNHFCVNAVCRAAGQAEAVLIRAVEAQFGLDILRQNRPGHPDLQLTNGPGKLCAALAIGRELDGADLCDPASPLFLARHPEVAGFRRSRRPLLVSPRVGITKAADWPLRFFLQGSPGVSRRGPMVNWEE